MAKAIPKEPIKFGIFTTKPHLKWAVTAIFFVFIATTLDRYLVVILKNFIDEVSKQPTDFSNVWFWALAYPYLYFIGQNLWRGSGFTGMRWFMNLRQTAYQDLYDYLSLHSKDYFNNRFAGALTNKVSNAVDGTEDFLEKVLWNFFPLILGLLWYIFFSFLSDWRLGMIISVWSIIFFGLNFWFARKLEVYSYKFAETLSTLKGRIVDSLSNISLVHEYAQISGEREYIGEYVEMQRNIGLKRWWLSEWVLVANGFLLFIFTLSMIGTSVYLFQKNIVTVGVIVMVISILVDLSRRLFFIGQEIRDASKNYGQVREGLLEILCKHVIVDIADAKELKVKNGNITLESIDFEYDNSKVFENFSLQIPGGQRVGFVGKSGAGKTTFASLLLRHFDVSSGKIKIDGQDISRVKLESLRKAIAFVPQDTSLFHRSIKDNIRYSSSGVNDNQVIKAARMAQADEFIRRLPKGYMTMVGERGVKLSGGQRQRVAIARAFLKNAPIIVLDEATSSLDTESERTIQNSLDSLMKGRTVIAIAHRLSTLKKMDRIVVIENGRILEDGAPDKLLRNKDGHFKKMWEHQVKGFIIDDEV